MPSKKSTSKKRVRVLQAPAGMIPRLANAPERRKTAGAGSKRSAGGGKPIKRLRNPWTPDDIVILLKFGVTYQAGKYLIELVKLWMDYRKAQKIEIKVGDNELKIERPVSDKVLEKRTERFRELIKEVTYDDIEVTLPKGTRRNIPVKLATKKGQGGKDK
jgi:hypothetical protein